MPGARHCWSLHDKKVVSAEIPVDGCLQHGFSFLRQMGKGALPTSVPRDSQVEGNY